PPGLAGLNASGSARARITVNKDAGGAITSGIVTFDVVYQFPGTVTLSGLHIHSAAVGVNGGVVINSGLAATTDDDGAGSLTRTTPPLTTASQIAALAGLESTPHLYYINLHTSPDFPNGAIRGQCTSETYFYKATMLPSNEVPAITGLNASASVLVTLDVTRDSSGNITSGAIMFDANYQFPGTVTFTGFHIHRQVAGVNGPVVLDSRTSGITDATGIGRLTRIISLATTQTILDDLKAVIANPSGHYINLHTSVPAHPGGAVRAQLSDANQFTSIPSVLEDPTFRSNLGIQNLTNMPSTVVVNVAGPTGAGSEMTVAIPPRGFVQLLNVNTLFGVGTRGVVHLDPDQHVVAFVSTIENATNIPFIIPMNSKGTRLAIAAVSNLGGRYVSSLVVANEGRSEATVVIRARDASGAAGDQGLAVSIPAGGFFYTDDILAALGIPSGFGPLEIRSTNGQPISAQSLVVSASANRGAVMPGTDF
ncbi:MAG TPA: CHRD domain-containing protein, partial [Terriglobia bacterium]|nr:CHRD domain-containing protein [Terriglobia bacterium]